MERFVGILILCLLLAGCRRLPGGANSPNSVIFQDDFSDAFAGNWQLEGDAQGRAEIVDGKLLLTVNAPATAQYVTLDGQVFRDLNLDVEATQTAGAAGGSYGLLVRMAAPGQFYRFEITSNGDYTVERHDGAASWERLTDGWQSSPAILRGVNETNRLRVAAVGETLSFYANDTLLVQLFDGAYEVGAIALDAGAFNQSELQVAFDNVVITEP